MKRSVPSAAPLVAVVLTVGALLLAVGTPLSGILRFVGYWVCFVAVPGVSVWRLLAPRWQRPFDVLVIGCCVGYALELAAFGACAGVGARWLFWTYPALVTVPTWIAARRWPRQLRPDASDRRGAAWYWATSGVAVAVLMATATWYYLGTPWPVRHPLSLSMDLYYQLGWASDATRTMPPTPATVSGVRQPYEWFLFAHLAAAHQISGVSLPWLVFRLDLVPPLLLYVGVISCAAARLARRPWAGPFAAAVTPLMSELNLGQDRVPWAQGCFKYCSYYSPTWVYGLVYLAPLLLFLPEQFAPVERGDRARLRWVVVVLMLAAASGAKVSILPVLLAGCVAATVYTAVRDRQQLPTTGLATGAVLGVFVVSTLIIYDGGGGGRLILLQLMPWFVTTYGFILSPPAPGATSTGRLLSTVAGIPALLAGYLGALGLVRTRAGRPAQVFLLGCFAGGYLAATCLHDPSGSEHWFVLTGSVALSVLAGWGAAALAERIGRPLMVATGLTAALLGLLVTLLLVDRYTSVTAPIPNKPHLLTMIELVVLLAAILAALAALLARGRRVATAVWTSVLTLGGAALASTPLMYAQPIFTYRMTGQAILPENITPRSRTDLTPGLVEGLDWLREHSRSSDVVAVNNHCLIQLPSGACRDHRVFYYSGLSERRMLLESWAYSKPTFAQASRERRFLATLPSPYPDRSRLNDAIFTHPTLPALDRAYEQYGVRWLLIDLRDGVPPRALNDLTARVHRTASVIIFRVRRPTT